MHYIILSGCYWLTATLICSPLTYPSDWEDLALLICESHYSIYAVFSTTCFHAVLVYYFLNVWWSDYFEVFLFDIQSILFGLNILVASAKLILSQSFCNLVILNFSWNFLWTVCWKNLTQSYLCIYVQWSSKTLFFTFPSTSKKHVFVQHSFVMYWYSTNLFFF